MYAWKMSTCEKCNGNKQTYLGYTTAPGDVPITMSLSGLKPKTGNIPSRTCDTEILEGVITIEDMVQERCNDIKMIMHKIDKAADNYQHK